jgi:peptide/nickel transport system permease protein
MAQATISIPAAAAPRTFVGKTLHILRRWPVLPIVVLTALAVTGIFAPLIAPHNPTLPDVANRASPPAWYENGNSKHLLGTDHIGRDLLSRIVYGARVSLMVVAISTTSGCVIGTLLGLVSGYFGRHLDEIIMRLVDIWLSVPFILVALIVVVVLGQSFGVLMALLALLAWTPFVRNVRAEVLSLKTRDYVSLAKVAGASTARIMFIHILPGVINTVIVIATLRVGQLILSEAILSFLGVGIPPPTPAWGSMVSDGRGYLNTAWWISFFPGMAIFLVVMSFNFIGDWIRDRLDPRLRQL